MAEMIGQEDEMSDERKARSSEKLLSFIEKAFLQFFFIFRVRIKNRSNIDYRLIWSR